ncbi:MAG: calcium-binding protein [Microcoleus sp.]
MPKFEKPKLKKSKFPESQSQDDRQEQSKSGLTAKLPPIQLDETIVAGRRPKKLSQLERLLMEMPDFNLGQLAIPVEIAGSEPFEVKEFETKVSKILNSKNIDVNGKKLTKYLEYLKQNLRFPCLVTGREDFAWEEEYVLGSRSKKEYERLKKTQPSYTDTFSIAQFEDSFNSDEGLIVTVQRLSDKKQFILPLVDLEACDESSPNNQLLDDYAVWFVNY